MKQHIVLVHSVANTTISYSHGLASIASKLLAVDDYPFDIALVTIRNNDTRTSTKEILSWNPVIVLVTAMSNQWARVNSIASTLKEMEPLLPICVGGTHIIADPSAVESTSFDVGFPGEGENSIQEIVYGGSLDIESVVKRARRNCLSRAIVSDLNRLPLPGVRIFSKQDILQYPSVMFSRGCPFQCTYCMSRKGGFARRVRWKSVERAIKEVLDLAQYAQPSEIYIDDDCFLKNPVWAIEFCRVYGRTVGIPFYCNSRPEHVTRQLAGLLRQANCQALGIGIESGSMRIRRDVLQRSISDDEILQAFENAHAEGLQTWSFNMVGIPGERDEDLLATIRLNERAKTEFLRVSVFTPYPGTPIFNSKTASRSEEDYFCAESNLPRGLLYLYREWMDRLEREDRLWLTRSELWARETNLKRSGMSGDRSALP
jgi:anaerobic magnesium-protoporphyrin IX monomethyl ester cyclase